MKILIIGANFLNKGGHLMLLSTIDFVKQRFGEEAPVISYSVGPLDQLGNLGCQLLNFPLLHISQPLFGQCLTNGMLVSANRSLDGDRVNWADLTGILDISGFVYSDQWGKVPMQNLMLLSTVCQTQKRKLIFLPQAYGPFNDKTNRDLARQAFPMASKIYVRDKTSMRHMKSLGASFRNDQVQLAPDITLTYASAEEAREPYCCFTPNIRLLDQGKEKWEKDYLTIIGRAMQAVLKETDLEIRLLIHDKGGDTRIAEVLEQNLKSPRIKRESAEEPKAVKHVIARSQFIVGSRFHALAGALSTGTPAIALGWSHKYRELFADYGVEDYCFLEPSADISMRLKTLIVPESRAELSARLRATGSEIASRSQAMWDEVETILRS